MKQQRAILALGKSLGRLLSVARMLANDAERDFLNGRPLPTGFQGRHTRQRATCTRALRRAWRYAKVINHTHLNASLIAIGNLTDKVVEHSLGFFPNNDYDARHSPIWAVLADLRANVIEARRILKSGVQA